MQFTPERERLSDKTYTRALVDSDDLEWVELSADTKDSLRHKGAIQASKTDIILWDRSLGKEKMRISERQGTHLFMFSICIYFVAFMYLSSKENPFSLNLPV